MRTAYNCWEFKKCGYGPKGSKAYYSGMCTAAMETRFDGIHNGLNGGRACWLVQGTNCRKKDQENFAQEYLACMECDFYLRVKKDVGNNLASFNHPDIVRR